MKYTSEEIIQYVEEENVKFIRLAFCDVFGKQKNIAIMPEELPRAFKYGIAFDASAIAGFSDEAHSDLFLHPIADTFTLLPWRPESGKVIRMYSYITYPDGTPFECDSRYILENAVKEAAKEGFEFSFGPEQEFYLFLLDEKGNETKIPYDNASYMDIAPDDKGENIRREICLTLERMGIHPESSHHEEGPGQNEIDFRFADPVTSADNAQTFQMVVKAIAQKNGLAANFTPKPLIQSPGNGFHINISVKGHSDDESIRYLIAGILRRISEITVFLNPCENSYKRLGHMKAPSYITWSKENRSQLLRIPAAFDEYRRAELRSADPTANPYIAFTLLIYAGMEGLKEKLIPGEETCMNLYAADKDTLSHFERLPMNLFDARDKAANSEFVQKHLPKALINALLEQ